MNARLHRLLLLQGHWICCYFCLSTGVGYFLGIERFVAPSSIFVKVDVRDHWLVGSALLAIAAFGLVQPFPGSVMVAMVGSGLRGYDAWHQGNLLLLGTYALAILFGVLGSYVWDRDARWGAQETARILAQYADLARDT